MNDSDRGERLASLESEVKFIKDLLIGMNMKFDNFSDIYVPRKELDITLKAKDERIRRLEERQEWHTRAILGGIISGLIGVVFLILSNGLGV